MSIHLLAAGSNYSGESCALPDCEFDVLNVADVFAPYCRTDKALLGEKSTRRKTLIAVRKFLKSLAKGDLGLLYFSGHGTTDRIGAKEIQATVTHDLELIYEHEWREVLAKRAAGSLLVSLADCCYSGGLRRGSRRGSRRGRSVAALNCFHHKTDLPTREGKRPNALYAACRAGEVAYSTGTGGAMTLALIEAFAERTIKTTLPALHKAVQKRLPSGEWDQHPVFACDTTLKKRTLKSFVNT